MATAHSKFTQILLQKCTYIYIYIHLTATWMHFTEPTTQTRANANSILFCIFKYSTLIGAVSVYEYLMVKEWIQSILSMNDRNA